MGTQRAFIVVGWVSDRFSIEVVLDLSGKIAPVVLCSTLHASTLELIICARLLYLLGPARTFSLYRPGLQASTWRRGCRRSANPPGNDDSIQAEQQQPSVRLLNTTNGVVAVVLPVRSGGGGDGASPSAGLLARHPSPKHLAAALAAAAARPSSTEAVAHFLRTAPKRVVAAMYHTVGTLAPPHTPVCVFGRQPQVVDPPVTLRRIPQGARTAVSHHCLLSRSHRSRASWDPCSHLARAPLPLPPSRASPRSCSNSRCSALSTAQRRARLLGLGQGRTHLADPHCRDLALLLLVALLGVLLDIDDGLHVL